MNSSKSAMMDGSKLVGHTELIDQTATRARANARRCPKAAATMAPLPAMILPPQY